MRSNKLALAMMAAAFSAGIAGAASAADDPYIWLEDVSSPKAMQWVEEHNAKSTAVLEADPRYAQYYKEALDIAQAKDRIPVGNFIGGQVYNFWQDTDHVRGIWRRASIASYSSGQPEWETVLDLDALATAEKANWVWHGATCARPAERRCLLSLSDGGEDADTVREFDLSTKSFVEGGFVLPKGKQNVELGGREQPARRPRMAAGRAGARPAILISSSACAAASRYRPRWKSIGATRATAASGSSPTFFATPKTARCR